MLYYPQLSSGSISQYPVVRRNQRRTIVNILADGSDIRMEDAGAAHVTWDLTYNDISDDELTEIQQLFDKVEGRLRTFTFVDPADNLLNWSEDFSQTVWTVDPLIQSSIGVADPFGTNGATQMVNTGQAGQRLGQTVATGSSLQYCFSMYLRSDAPCTVELIAASAADQSRRAFAVNSSWMRMIAPVRLTLTDDRIYFGLELAAGSSVIVFGPQVDAQLGAGGYKKTTNIAGVYPNSRFDSDNLEITGTGPNHYSLTVRVKSCVAG